MDWLALYSAIVVGLYLFMVFLGFAHSLEKREGNLAFAFGLLFLGSLPVLLLAVRELV